MITIIKKLVSKFRPTSLLREVRSIDDYEFICSRCIEESKAGHFHPSYSLGIKKLEDGLRHQIACAVNDQPYPFEPGNPRNGTGARIAIIEQQGQRLGFLLVLEESAGSWAQRVELHLMSLIPEARGQKITRRVIRELLKNIPSREIYARCYRASAAMAHILEAEGFKVTSISETGTKTLELQRRN